MLAACENYLILIYKVDLLFSPVYHQHCHVPRVEDDEVNQKFVCRICVFASCAQVGWSFYNLHQELSKFLLKSYNHSFFIPDSTIGFKFTSEKKIEMLQWR